MEVKTKLYTVHVYWTVLKSSQIEQFTNYDDLIKFVSFFEGQLKTDDDKPAFKLSASETSIHYFTAAEQWHIASPKELDMNLLREKAQELLKKPKVVTTDATLELKPGESITK